VRPYADRGLVTRQQWNGIICDAAREMWLYGMAEFGYATDDAVPGILVQATGRGCRVRILLLNPQSQITERRGIRTHTTADSSTTSIPATIS
jgi:hypothetical protein